jgi:hypothetical protein
MYSTRLLNKNIVEGNKYITVGDPYKDPLANTFRQDKKGENKPMVVKVDNKIINDQNIELYTNYVPHR